MSLVVWLPLTKDLRNQGLSNITATNSGATYSSTGGKLGGCYSFDGTDDAIGVGNLSTIVGTEFSWSCWFYRSEWSSKSWETIFGGPSGFELETKNGSTNSPLMYAYSWGKGTFTYELNQWNHLVMTRTTSETKFYLNGELKLTGSAGSIPSGNYFVGSWSSTTGQNFKGKVNDVRIYDHCLSPMEVKELSKGLILHYPLNRGGWGQENLVVNYRNSGNTSYYSTTLSAQVYEIDSSMPSGYHQKCTIGTASGTGGPYWVGTTTNGNTGTQISQLIADAWYTVSYYIKGTITHSGIISTTAEFLKNITFIERPTINTEWQRVTFYGQYNGNTTSNIAITIYEGSKWTAGEVFYFSSLKVEPGKIRTQWIPHSSDILYTTMGLNGTIEYDCSGFCNNGEKIGTLTYTSDTPKYAVSTHIGATTQKIHISNFPTSGFGNSYSFAWWGKRTSNNPMFWGFSDGIRLNGMYTGTLWNTGDSGNNPIYVPGTTTTITAPSVNVWHHYVMTGDGTTCKLYVDGVLYGQAKTYKAISGTSIYINGWDSGTSYCSDNTDMSDFRIYATALSADDVKSLYQNCATIDPDGTIRGQIRS